MRLADQGPHVVAGDIAGADFHFCDFDPEAGDHGVGGGVTDRDDQRHGHAALPAGPVGGTHHRADGIGHVCIGHHHRVVFRAAKRLYTLAVGATGRVYIFGDRCRPDEADGVDALVGQQRVDGFLVAVHHVEHPRWQAGLDRELRHQQCTGRIALRGLEDEGVAAGDGHRDGD